MATNDTSVASPEELNRLFLDELRHTPEWEKIKECIQCGTCTASCPTSWAMDYGPREIMDLFRTGKLEKVLRSNTMWTCVSCYTCSVRCPSGIKLSDIVYALRAIAIRTGLYGGGETAPALSTTFVGLVDKYGKNVETELLTRFYLRTNPLGLGKILPLGLKLMRRGRLPLLPKRIQAPDDLKKIMARLEQEESK